MSETPSKEPISHEAIAFLLAYNRNQELKKRPRRDTEEAIKTYRLNDGFCLISLEPEGLYIKALRGFTPQDQVYVWDLAVIARQKKWPLSPQTLFENAITQISTIDDLIAWCTRQKVIQHLKLV